ncbi:hypothetical protein NQ038_05420 [Brevibacterium sp. 50QC2O2]|uniref:hypothetical protein n=1 Tax=Brevibacterium sp. 50QC2O2 TaxID=2968459 RepID=UPI00211C6109|nr:hypothetical protein [Brevibacterium sp. 50QC2O2]MCQ9388085.1 hypothetical protein [Brevibacterium sp. 50QC2O2]
MTSPPSARVVVQGCAVAPEHRVNDESERTPIFGGIACFFISSDDTVGIVALVSAAWLIAFTLGASLIAVRAVKSVR